MIRNDRMVANNPIAILVTAMRCIVAENPLCRDSVILFEMKYERFNVIANFSGLAAVQNRTTDL